MRYAQIRSMDISNGEGVGISLFVQGCHFHCKNCFNPETWDFSGGEEWTSEAKEKFLELANRPYIKRISILGGEPLAEENLDGVLDLVNRIRLSMPQKSIWLYTGYTWEDIIEYEYPDYAIDLSHPETRDAFHMWEREEIIKKCDVLIDGQYIESQRNITLSWCGSENQRVIAIQKSLQKGEVVLWTD